MFSRMRCVGRPGVEVRYAAKLPQTWIANSMEYNDVINGLNIGNARRRGGLNSPKKLSNWQNTSMVANDSSVLTSDFER